MEWIFIFFLLFRKPTSREQLSRHTAYDSLFINLKDEKVGNGIAQGFCRRDRMEIGHEYQLGMKISEIHKSIDNLELFGGGHLKAIAFIYDALLSYGRWYTDVELLKNWNKIAFTCVMA